MWHTEEDRNVQWKVVAGLVAVASVLQGVFGVV